MSLPAKKPLAASYESTYDYYTALIKNGHMHLADHMLVGIIDVQQQFGSIILPDSAQREQNTATILLIASNLDAKDYPLKAHFIPSQHAGKEICSSGKNRLVVYDVREDIHAIFMPDDVEAVEGAGK